MNEFHNYFIETGFPIFLYFIFVFKSVVIMVSHDKFATAFHFIKQIK